MRKFIDESKIKGKGMDAVLEFNVYYLDEFMWFDSSIYNEYHKIFETASKISDEIVNFEKKPVYLTNQLKSLCTRISKNVFYLCIIVKIFSHDRLSLCLF